MSAKTEPVQGSARADLVASGLLIVLAAVVIVDTLDYPPSLTAESPGPALFPRLLAAALALLACVLAWRSWRARTTPAAREVDFGWTRVLLAAALVAGLLLLLSVWDFFLALPLFIAGLMAIMGERSWKTLLLVPLVFDLFVYVVFYRLFGVPFPTVFL